MYLPDQAPDKQSSLELLETATQSPEELCESDPEVKAAFEESLRDLAEDIVKHHPGLAHLLLGMGETPCPVVHGQN
ncbi:MAG: hypothetical protein P1U68_05600 [Verrucomicrobiales bacterium]|nr:hypothetical protein [Verrucomicrobiales bacterium]